MSIGSVRNHLIYCPVNGLFLWSKSKIHKRWSVAGSVTKSHHSGKSYIKINVIGKTFLAHRLAWYFYYGEIPSGQIDHIDGNSSNNSIHNLRIVTASDNQRNARLNSSNSSGICGVGWDRSRDKWNVKIGVNGKTLNLGRYSDFFEACCVRKSAERKYGFHMNHGSRRPL